VEVGQRYDDGTELLTRTPSSEGRGGGVGTPRTLPRTSFEGKVKGRQEGSSTNQAPDGTAPDPPLGGSDQRPGGRGEEDRTAADTSIPNGNLSPGTSMSPPGT
jgi:hypothetical protein